jgi:hypothetical protein
MNIRKIIKEEIDSLDWVSKVEPYEVGDEFLDWDGSLCWIAEIDPDRNEVLVGTYDDGDDDPSYYPYNKDDMDQYFNVGELKVIKEDLDWAKQVVDDTPSEGDVYIVPKAFWGGHFTLPKGKITIDSVNNTPHHGIIALVTVYDEIHDRSRVGISIKVKDIMDSLENGDLIKD